MYSKTVDILERTAIKLTQLPGKVKASRFRHKMISHIAWINDMEFRRFDLMLIGTPVLNLSLLIDWDRCIKQLSWMIHISSSDFLKTKQISIGLCSASWQKCLSLSMEYVYIPSYLNIMGIPLVRICCRSLTLDVTFKLLWANLFILFYSFLKDVMISENVQWRVSIQNNTRRLWLVVKYGLISSVVQ